MPRSRLARYATPVTTRDKLTANTLATNRSRTVVVDFLHKYCAGISALVDDIDARNKRELADRVHDVIDEWKREERLGIEPADRLWKWRVETDRFVPFVDGLDGEDSDVENVLRGSFDEGEEAGFEESVDDGEEGGFQEWRDDIGNERGFQELMDVDNEGGFQELRDPDNGEDGNFSFGNSAFGDSGAGNLTVMIDDNEYPNTFEDNYINFVESIENLALSTDNDDDDDDIDPVLLGIESYVTNSPPSHDADIDLSHIAESVEPTDTVEPNLLNASENPAIDLTHDDNNDDDPFPSTDLTTISPTLLHHTHPPHQHPLVPSTPPGTLTRTAFVAVHPQRRTGLTLHNPTRADDIKTRLREYMAHARYRLVHRGRLPYLSAAGHARLVQGIYAWPCFFVIEHYIQELVKMELELELDLASSHRRVGADPVRQQERDELLVRYGANAAALEWGIAWGGLDWGVGVQREEAAREVVRDVLRFYRRE